MSSIVVYEGSAPAVEGGGFLFVRGEPVEVPTELAVTLGSAFKVETKKEEE